MSVDQHREVIVIESDDRSAPGVQSAENRLKALRGQMDRLARVVISPVVRVTDAATAPLRAIRSSLGEVGKMAAGFALGGAITALPGFLIDAAKGAAEDAASLGTLQQAVTNSGAAWSQYSDQLNATINDGMRKAFSDDELRGSLSLLIAQTGSAGEAQKRLGLAMDLSRGAGIDLTSASKLLGKVTDDNTTALSRMGITIRKGATEAELFGAVQQKFGGQAEAYAQSTAGQMEALGKQMGELREQVGYMVLPVMARLASFALNTLVPLFANKLIPAIGTLGTLLVRRFGPAIVAARALFRAFTRDAGALGIVVDQVRATFGDRAGDMLDPLLSGLMRAIPSLRSAGSVIREALVGGLDLRVAGVLLAEQLQAALGHAMGGVDFGAAGAALATRLRDAVTGQLAAVDWTAAGQSVASGIGDAAAAANPAPLKAAADSHASAYVQAFGAKVAAAPPVKVPGMDKTVSFAGVGAGISDANGPLGQFGVLFAGLVPALLIAGHVLPGVIAGISGLATVVGGAAAAFSAGAVALGAFLLPILLIAAAVAGLYVLWVNDVGGIQELTASAVGAILGWFGQLPALFEQVMAVVVPALQAAAAWLTQVGTAIAQYLAPYVVQLGPPLAELGQKLSELAAAVLPALQAALVAVGPFLQSVGSFLLDLGKTALPIVQAALEIIAPLILQGIVESIKALLAVIGLAVDALKVALPVALDVAKGAIEGVTAVVGFLHGAFDTAKGVIGDTVQFFKDLKGVADDVVTSIQGVINTLAKVPSAPGDVLSAAGDVLGFGGGKAAGGPVAAGVPYLVGERGPELFASREAGTIIPLPNLRQAAADRGSGGGSSIVLNVPGGLIRMEMRDGESDDAVAERLAPPIARVLAREIGRARLSANLVGG